MFDALFLQEAEEEWVSLNVKFKLNLWLLLYDESFTFIASSHNHSFIITQHRCQVNNDDCN